MIELLQGDITKEGTDAIVNAANSTLLGGGGVDGAIHRAAGPGLLEECKQIRKETYPSGLPTGKAVITKGYNLRAKYVIHTVGPVYDPSMDQSNLLRECFVNSLDLAEKYKLESIAFPAISTGAYGYPKRGCAEIMNYVFSKYSYNSIKKVRIVLFSEEDYLIFKRVF